MDNAEFLGTVVGTQGAVKVLVENKTKPTKALREHAEYHIGDEVIGVDYFSQFHVNQTLIWIITKADHSKTLILLPEEQSSGEL